MSAIASIERVLDGTIADPGIYDAVPFDDYLADPCPQPSLSSSIALELVTRSPLHARHRHPRLGAAPREESTTADLGSVAHDLLLHGEGKIVVVDADNWRTKAAREARDTARAEGRVPILAAKLDEARTMTDVAREFIATSEVRAEWERGASEQTIVVREAEAWLRCRPDRLSVRDEFCGHYKTTDGTARPEDFIRMTMRRMEYGFVLAFYQHVMLTAFGGGRQFILAQEQNAPYACALIGLTPAKLAIESARVNVAVQTWRRCMASNVWPAYSGRVHYAEPAAWELAQAEEASA
jgi:hypothetical protein